MTQVNSYSLADEGADKIAEHFRVREFACKDGSDPVFIAPALAGVLEQIRQHFGAPVTVTSGYRTISHNAKQAGASPKSQHLYGLAADIQVEGHTPAEVAACAEALLPGAGGIGIYSTFTHVDVRRVKSRWDYR